MKYSALAVAVLAASPVVAQDVGSGRVSFGASTLGATAEVAYRFHSNFSVRGVAGGLVSLSGDLDVDANSYSIDADPTGVGLMVDWHTGVGGLRFSGGVFYHDLSISGNTSVGSSVVINGITYTGTDTVNYNADVNEEIAPALSIGYDQPLGERWVLSAEAGALFNGGYTASGSSANGLIPQADINAEIDAIQDDLDAIGVYPFISLTVGMRF